MKKLSLSTLAIHGGTHSPQTGPVVFPIHQTSNFEFETSEVLDRINRGERGGYIYSRYANPTVDEVRKKIALIAECDDALLFSSGMAAISTTIFSLCASEGTIVTSAKLYGGSYRFFRDVLPGHGISVKYFADDLSDLPSVIDETTSIVYFETPTNPTVSIIDIERLVTIVREESKTFSKNISIVLDNTFATVVNQKPFSFGVDVVLESATKYLGGHSDIVGGIVAARHELIERIQHSHKYFGGCMDPFAAFLLSRSLKTLDLRVRKQNENALAFARHFEKHPRLRSVVYPGLESHPDHAVAKKQMIGFGGILAVELNGGKEQVMECVDRFRVIKNAVSLGGVETLVSIPILTSHVNMSAEELRIAGVSERMMRFSIGIEDVQDVIDDVEQALQSIKA